MTEGICAICNLDIKRIKAFPVFSKKHNDTICSECCLIACYYHLNMISENQLNEIPENLKKELITLYKEQ